ncbi:hypothetical protein [Brevundimonas sp.]|uniref:hypothetical protein n=1 Tax=Brevundimonas sp. TaxID=1871086 RepID=UPI002ABAB0D1|nr:hypothetical protein [Brevundimonas sp.]MDZ4365363.1 hypothetical protein [Brevundimonas sp.]
MKNAAAISVLTLALLGTGSVAQAQSQTQSPPVPARPGSDLTRDLNSGPPYIAATPVPTAVPAATPAPRATVPVAAPATAAPRPATPAPTATISAGPPPAARAPTPLPATPVPAAAAPAASVPAPTAPVAEMPPPVAGVTILDAAARAALPFTLDLPAGFELVTGRPGPDFRIYTVRRGDQTFAMIYAGPASQFPIYDGQMAEATGRVSVVVTEDGRRRAMEHLFQRADAPREVHVWVSTLEGADRDLAEAIAQSVDVR